jgi:hypothetical protein
MPNWQIFTRVCRARPTNHLLATMDYNLPSSGASKVEDGLKLDMNRLIRRQFGTGTPLIRASSGGGTPP